MVRTRGVGTCMRVNMLSVIRLALLNVVVLKLLMFERV